MPKMQWNNYGLKLTTIKLNLKSCMDFGKFKIFNFMIKMEIQVSILLKWKAQILFILSDFLIYRNLFDIFIFLILWKTWELILFK